MDTKSGNARKTAVEQSAAASMLPGVAVRAGELGVLGAEGSPVTVRTETGAEARGRYALLEADDVVASHIVPERRSLGLKAGMAARRA